MFMSTQIHCTLLPLLQTEQTKIITSMSFRWCQITVDSATAESQKGGSVRLPLQPTTPHWETPSMAVRAIFAPVCHHRTARGLPYQIQTIFGRAVFYSTISIDDINAQSGWSLKTEKIRINNMYTLQITRHLFLTWTSLYPSLHFLKLNSIICGTSAYFLLTLTCIAYLNCT